MKIIAISGSPRDGNTDAMLKRVLDGAREKGATIELVKLREKEIEFCDGCDRCYGTGKGCHLVDDMQVLYKKCFEADAIVFGSPNYSRNMSAMMKNFVDRWDAYCKPSKLKGKKAVIVMPGGQPIKNIKEGAKTLENFIEDMEMKLVDEILLTVDAPRKVLKNEKIMQQCFDLGKKLAAEK